MKKVYIVLLLIFSNCYFNPLVNSVLNPVEKEDSFSDFFSLLLFSSSSTNTDDIATHQLSGRLTENGEVLPNTLLQLTNDTSSILRSRNRVTSETRTDSVGNFTLYLKEGKKILKIVSDSGEEKGRVTLEIQPNGRDPIIIIIPGNAYGLQNVVMSSPTNAFPPTAPVNVTETGTTDASTTLSFSYTPSSFVFTNGLPIEPLNPTLSNEVTSCSSSPPLPTGLSLNATSCAISGTPTENQSATNYVITAVSNVGTATSTISIEINQNPPAGLNYINSSLVFTQNSAITVQTPSVSGTVSSCISTPSLPEGLSINNTTCAISGTPTNLQTSNSYTITASNAFGNTTAEIAITVNLLAPSNLVYSSGNYTFTVGMLITTLIPTVSGTVTNCSVSPALPSGIVLNNTTCAISGTPTVAHAVTNYTITATNSGGSTSTNISVAVNSLAPSNLVYVGSPYTFTQGVAITTISPTFSGTVTSCTSSPALPSGLSINNTTCAISGTPTDATGSTNYTITASNSFGSNNASISIAVNLTNFTWSLQAYLKASNLDASDFFSSNGISISGNTIVVAASNDDSNQTTICNSPVNSTSCPGMLDNSNTNSGAAYVFVRSGTTWSQQAYLKASNSESGDGFGRSVSISGDTIIVGAVGEDSNQTTITNGTTASTDNSLSSSGAAYVFVRSGTTWSQQAYLKAPNADVDDRFGNKVSISGDTIVVGVGNEDSNQTAICNSPINSSSCPGMLDNSLSSSGAAYVFVRSGTTWSQQAYLKAPNSDVGDGIESSISNSGDTIVVGTIFESSNQTTICNSPINSSSCPGMLDNSLYKSGAAYVFIRSGTTWSQQAYLKAPNPDADDLFGISVSISGDTIVVGARQEMSTQTTICLAPINSTTCPGMLDNITNGAGAVHVFVRSGTIWSQEAYLKAPNSGISGWQFGYDVSISGDTIVVGAYDYSNLTTICNAPINSSSCPGMLDDSSLNSGAAHVFFRSGTTWNQQAYLKAPNADADDLFGFSVSISGDTIAVGARHEDSSQSTICNAPVNSTSCPGMLDNSASNSGAAYVFVRQ